MKFTAKCKYGLLALLEIADQQKKGIALVKRKTIVKNQQIPNSYLENILIILKNHGILKSARGTNGGYYLLKTPDKLTLYEIITILEGKSPLEECINLQGECMYNENCKIKLIWEEINRYQKKILEKITLEDLLDNESDCIPCFREKIQKIDKEKPYENA